MKGILKIKKNLTSIECGAFDGLTENCTKFFEENFNWNTINIEPLPHIFKKLKLNRPSSININIALSNYKGKQDIRVYDIPTHGINNTNASLCHLPKHQLWLEKAIFILIEEGLFNFNFLNMCGRGSILIVFQLKFSSKNLVQFSVKPSNAPHSIDVKFFLFLKYLSYNTLSTGGSNCP